MTSEEIFNVLRQVKYPGFSRDIVSFGLVKDVHIEGKNVQIALAYTTESSEKRKGIENSIHQCVGAMSGVASIQFEVTQTPTRPAAQRTTLEQRPIPGVKKVIAVASGKGGVGKSTVAVNLVCSLSTLGRKVGLLDADIYGPSVPLMMGVHDRPGVTDDNQLIPHQKYGVSVMSLGFFMEGDNPVIWRGPMVTGAIRQLLYDTHWGDLDYLIVDLPPGTGDAQLSLVQLAPIYGAVIVTTPQDVALIDAKKGVAMFQKLEVRILGIIENMSFFLCPHCHEQTDIFSRGGGRKEAQRLKVPFLGEIPIDVFIRSGGDEGIPVVRKDPHSGVAQAFLKAAEAIDQELASSLKV